MSTSDESSRKMIVKGHSDTTQINGKGPSSEQKRKNAKFAKKRIVNGKKPQAQQRLPPHMQTALLEYSRMLTKQFGPMQITVGSDGVVTRKRNQDIPYGWPEFLKGTEYPIFHLKLADTLVNLTASTQYNAVYNLQAQFLNNFNDASSMFDEYRFLRGKFEIIPATFVNSTPATPAANYTGGCAVDYGISAALASLDAGIAHDTWKWCQFVNTPGTLLKNGKGVVYPVELEKLTDETWIPCTTNNSTICFFKPFIPASAIPWTASNAFRIVGAFDVQFRGQAG